MGPTPFDTIMYLLPYWLPAVVVGLVLQWLVARSAARSALRSHAAEQHRIALEATRAHGTTTPGASGGGPQ